VSADLALLKDAALAAGELALEYRRRGLKIWSKSGGSPVTDADTAADQQLKTELRRARPDYGWLSEETADNPERLEHRRIFVVDPIDGTVAFMKSKPWWTVALAVVEDGRPIAAVVHAPQLHETFEAARDEGARLNGEPIRASDASTLDDAALLADAQLLERPIWREPWPQVRLEKRNSIAYRMALVAGGGFDAAITLSPKSDWDVCAGDLIAEEAGAKTSDHLGRPFVYNKPVPLQPSLICSAPLLHPLILRRCASISVPV
jgi:myo-inositol-1(or 4)-monophosphatase